MGGLAEGRLRRCPVSGGVESERDRELDSRRSGLGLLGWASGAGVNTGWLDDWVGVVGGVERPEAFLVLGKILMPAGEEMEEERKMPLKLRRWGDLGGEF